MSDKTQLEEALKKYFQSQETKDRIEEFGMYTAGIFSSLFRAGWEACLASRLEEGRPNNGKADMQAGGEMDSLEK